MIPASAVKATLYSLVSTLPYGDCQDLEFILKYIFWSEIPERAVGKRNRLFFL